MFINRRMPCCYRNNDTFLIKKVFFSEQKTSSKTLFGCIYSTRATICSIIRLSCRPYIYRAVLLRAEAAHCLIYAQMCPCKQNLFLWRQNICVWIYLPTISWKMQYCRLSYFRSDHQINWLPIKNSRWGCESVPCSQMPPGGSGGIRSEKNDNYNIKQNEFN